MDNLEREPVAGPPTEPDQETVTADQPGEPQPAHAAEPPSTTPETGERDAGEQGAEEQAADAGNDAAEAPADAGNDAAEAPAETLIADDLPAADDLPITPASSAGDTASAEETEAAPAVAEAPAPAEEPLPAEVPAAADEPMPAAEGSAPAKQTEAGPAVAEAPLPAVEPAATDVSTTVAAASPAPPTARRTVSQEIARQLRAAGARFCFTLPAEPILPLLDDLATAGIRVVTARHEGGAAFMAEALAQSTGRPQVVAVSRAVGVANAAVGIHTAQQDSAPLVALAGQVDSRLLGREAFQEADLVASVGSLASWAAQIDQPDDTVAVLAKAQRRLSSGRPGPVFLSVPPDVQTAEIELPDEEPPAPPGARGPAADRAAVSRAMKMLAASERGVIVAGGGVLRARAGKRLVALSEALAIPVIAAWRRPDVFPNDHVNYLGMSGTGAASTVTRRLADADVILFIGTRLSQVSTDDYAIPAPGTRWIHVDVQPRVAHAGLGAPSLAIAADAARFLDSAWSDLRAAALDNEMRSRREARNAADREAYKAACVVGQGAWDGPGVHPGRLVETLRAVLPDNATITTDAGNLTAFLARGFRFRRAGTFIGATSGTMGFGLPAAIAASLMDPDRIALAVCGDGGFAASAAELETAVREDAHPVAVVLDNRRYGMVAAQQERHGRPTVTTDLGAIDFAALARSYGALGFSVDDDDGFEPALREALASRRMSVIHVAVDRAWRSVDDHPFTSAP